MREVTLNRKTAETNINLTLNIDGTGISEISTGVAFFDHMLVLFSKHGRFDLTLNAQGDAVDNHHVIEDIGILLGKAFNETLRDKMGINRYAFSYTPMDEALSRICVDISGRSFLVFDVELDREFIGDFETEMLEEFFIAFAANSKMTLHIQSLYGKNNHHIVEGIFKGLGRTLKEACAIGEYANEIPSTKGIIE
ncbi:MAG: imidazoleglycerol-phosphate dehydratase [Eubacteriaceae bacterium]|jgi:imidazoleglycerol-phosphate dehydratase|nr:imidazoleglycerol-phosphate dehydratase [Eubacteriaceae bacterium]MDK2904233.1 imidazoleglycerol-phosphate dehydratase [Eubacteriaceae bacterium]MDK2935590.1 imidazoleglycerol-phosphate dehydratase [Eubacteriaceae bacterium]MDK2961255.1 imidazoleglycerol-phosphate dehydratase [Eubacteriaceae bacterium]MDN5306734.1 imidazoleglycerol-phosphate dehydratase [Eubacteriaceae bacterium]